MYSAGNGTLSNVEAMGSLVKTPLHIRDGPMIAVFWDNVVVNAAFFCGFDALNIHMEYKHEIFHR